MTFVLNLTTSEKKKKTHTHGGGGVGHEKTEEEGTLGKEMACDQTAFNETNARGSWPAFLDISCPHVPCPVLIPFIVMSS